MGVFMREPLLDWQREARVVSAKRNAPGSAKDSVPAAETADPADMHVKLKVTMTLPSNETLHAWLICSTQLNCGVHCSSPSSACHIEWYSVAMYM